MLPDRIKQFIESQAQKLNIPIHIIQKPSARLSNTNIIHIIFDADSEQSVTVDESAITIGLQPTKENAKPINQFLKDSLPILAQTYHKSQKDQLKRLVLSGIEMRKSSLKDAIQQGEFSLSSLNREMFETSRKVELDRQILGVLNKPVAPVSRKINAEYSNFKKLVPSMYQSIELEDGLVRAKTQHVAIEYDSTEYDIGILLIELDLSKGQAKITNLTNCPNGYAHPHVSDGGDICLGNISSGLTRMIGEFEIYGALELLHKFLHSYNEPDSYQKIQYWNDPDWAEDEDDEYDRCRENGSYGKTCLDCGDSECPYYDGALEECAEEPDFPKCVNCDQRCNAGNKLLADCHSENPLCCMTCSFTTCSYYHDSNSCRKANSEFCPNCNIDYCQFKGVAHETA